MLVYITLDWVGTVQVYQASNKDSGAYMLVACVNKLILLRLLCFAYIYINNSPIALMLLYTINVQQRSYNQVTIPAKARSSRRFVG
jgi:hypothetical protein